jgi:hypothetical protein
MSDCHGLLFHLLDNWVVSDMMGKLLRVCCPTLIDECTFWFDYQCEISFVHRNHTTSIKQIYSLFYSSTDELNVWLIILVFISQCEEVETELSGVVQQRRVVLHNCLEVLHTYASIIGQVRGREPWDWLSWKFRQLWNYFV